MLWRCILSAFRGVIIYDTYMHDSLYDRLSSTY
nr:MAG TPA: hypothetical protein [Inoviridae sp.]